MSRVPLSSQILSDIEFEMAFFSYIAESTNFDIVPIPYEDGTYITKEEYFKILEDCKKNGIRLLLRISNGDTAIVLNPLTGKTGIVPENNASGFSC